MRLQHLSCDGVCIISWFRLKDVIQIWVWYKYSIATYQQFNIEIAFAFRDALNYLEKRNVYRSELALFLVLFSFNQHKMYFSSREQKRWSCLNCGRCFSSVDVAFSLFLCCVLFRRFLLINVNKVNSFTTYGFLNHTRSLIQNDNFLAHLKTAPSKILNNSIVLQNGCVVFGWFACLSYLNDMSKCKMW